MATNSEIDKRRDESVARAIAYSTTFVAKKLKVQKSGMLKVKGILILVVE